ncbi:SusC/RagA family TonB-linked outer membrane protein [Mucilaginibacter sp. UC70_90]
MKLTIILLIIGLTQVSAKTFGQLISLHEKKAPVQKVFSIIEKQTGYHFVYDEKLDEFLKGKTVDIDIENRSVTDILDLFVKQIPVSYKIIQSIIALKQTEQLQGDKRIPAFRKISGTVKDDKGEPLIGASVQVKGTGKGTITTITGEFSIEVNPGDVLVISYVGFQTKEVTIASQSSIEVVMTAATNGLNELVVIGYGSLNLKEVSSAITHVSGKDLLSVGGNGALMSLQGKVAGLTVVNTAPGDPNSSPNLQLRGVSSRDAGLGPLYVIDGVAGGNIDNINQNDIASIDVLKGGAASAIYGTRGSNGVVLVTTKKGSADSHTNYNDYFSFDLPTNRLQPISADEFVQKQRGYDYGYRTNWLNSITRNYAFSQKHSIALSGGNGKTNYYVSGDYRKAQGIDLRSSKEEYGARINITHTPQNSLYTVTVNIAPRYLKSSNADYGGYAQALTLNPTQPIRDTTNASYYYYVTNGLPNPYNPVEEDKTVLTGTEGKYLDWNASFKLNILRNWNTQVSVSQSNTSFFDYWSRPSTNTQAINLEGGRSRASRAYNVYDTKNLEWTTNYSLTYKKHNLKLLGGYSYVYGNNQGLSGSNSQFPTDAFTYNNLGAGVYNLIAGQNNVGSYQEDSRLIAFFGRLNYSFNDELFISGSLRREGSSKFGQDHKWGSFPAVSVAWDLSQRPFIKQFGWIDQLKLRGDYGVTGNQSFGNYLSLDTYTGYGYYLYNGVYYQVYGPSQNTNYDLHWEKAINYNFGVDFSLSQGLVTGSLNYYTRKNQDLLGSYNVPLPPNVQGTIYANVGSMQNSGVELQLNVNPVKTKNFNYTISLAGATLNNKFISFSNNTYKGQSYIDVVSLPSPGSPGTIQRLQEGKRIGSFYMLKSAGIDATGGLLVYNKSGQVIPGNLATADDKQYVGNGLPKFTASLGNTFKYKNWDASVYLRGAFDYSIFNTNAFYIGTPATGQGTNVLKSAYDGGKYSVLSNPTTLAVASDYFLESGGFVKVDNITLGYTYQSKSKYFHSVRVFVTGRNLYTFTKFTGGDPESVSVNGLYPGVNASLSYYPSTLQLLGGVQVSF